MGRLVRSRTKVQKIDAENSPLESTKTSRNVKLNYKNIPKIGTKSISKVPAGPSADVGNIEDKKGSKPIYASKKKASIRKSLKDIEERLHLYDFEVDENEPVVKKVKRKPILKIKKHRTYKSKFKLLPENLIELEGVGKENVYPSSKVQTPSKKTSVPLAEISNIPMEDKLDLSIDASVPSRRLTLYSPQPYRSPKRDSLSVPVLRTSDCNVLNINTSSRSLNVTTDSIKHDKSSCSAYSGSFMNRLFIGSSTPIRNHWNEDSESCVVERTVTNYGNFDVSNNFGFEADNSHDEPFISPIKTNESPVKSVPSKSPLKQSPVKVPFKKVIKMLKFGCDVSDGDEDLSFEGLPDNFYHEGDTPAFSCPSTPEHFKKVLPNCFPNRTKKKKHIVFKEDSDDSGNITQSSEEKEAQEKCGAVYHNKRRNLKMIKEENDKGYETEDQNLKKRQVRRSYERPAYLRSKKKVIGPFAVEDEEDDDHEEIMPAKTGKKKHAGPSKKEEMELEKWAKAFNEQCLQIENFNLCVE